MELIYWLQSVSYQRRREGVFMFFIIVVAVCLLLILWCSDEAVVSIIKFVRSLFDKSYNLDRLDCFGSMLVYILLVSVFCISLFNIVALWLAINLGRDMAIIIFRGLMGSFWYILPVLFLACVFVSGVVYCIEFEYFINKD